jgi:hypothetical protein
MPIPVLVTVYPESDKVSRVEELVKWVTEEVRKNEPAVSDYRSYKGRAYKARSTPTPPSSNIKGKYSEETGQIT